MVRIIHRKCERTPDSHSIALVLASELVTSSLFDQAEVSSDMLKFDLKKIGARKEDLIEKCRELVEIEIELVSEEGLEIPEVKFQICCSNGYSETGVLDEHGRRKLYNLPNDDFLIEYFDFDEIRAKVFAARLNNSISERNVDGIFAVLDLPADELHDVAAFYRHYYAGNLASDIECYFHGVAGGITVRQILQSKGFHTDLSGSR